MRLSDLQNKDIVDIYTGQKVGNVIDVEISSDTGNILSIIIFERKSVINLFKSEETLIKWEHIKKIGEDVILISRNL